MTKSEKFALIHELRQRSDSLLTVENLCRTAGVSVSGYYNWIGSAGTRESREAQDQQDFDLILRAYNHRGYNKGARGIYMTMVHWDPPVIMNLKKIRRLMKKYGLVCPIRQANPYRRIARAMKTDAVVGNLVERHFTERGPRKVLLTDITYMPWHDGFLYLCTNLDACTREVPGWSLSDSLEVDFVLEAVEMAMKAHGNELSGADVLIHSDQGCHYTSRAFRQLVKDKGLTQSMSRRGNCWDNSPQESFFGHMKDEYDLSGCATFGEAKRKAADWISYYNTERYQWTLAKLSPREFYEYKITGVYPLKGVPEPKAGTEEITNAEQQAAQTG